MNRTMNFLAIASLHCLIAFASACSVGKPPTGNESSITFAQSDSGKRIDVLVQGQLFTSYQWPDSVFKPVLYPIINAAGTEITRGYPLNPRPNERVDHPHHVGMWLNYGNVNGIDFWGNSTDIPLETRSKTGGNIKFLRYENMLEGAGTASITVYNSWQDPNGKELLLEKTTFDFIAKDSLRIIDRITTLTATAGEVKMPDTKEGMFAIRVARQLELPSREEVTLTDAAGNATTVPQLSNDGVTGNYLSSEGVQGDSVWGKKARWMNLYGEINGEKVSVIICDHPQNPGYPTYWHARGYGLFSVNPFGAKDFTQSQQTMNFSIPANQSATLRYRLIVTSSKHLGKKEINALADEFGRKY